MIAEMLIVYSIGGAVAPGDVGNDRAPIAQADSTRDPSGRSGASSRAADSAGTGTKGTPGTTDSKGDSDNSAAVPGGGEGLGGTSSPDMKRAREKRDEQERRKESDHGN